MAVRIVLPEEVIEAERMFLCISAACEPGQREVSKSATMLLSAERYGYSESHGLMWTMRIYVSVARSWRITSPVEYS